MCAKKIEKRVSTSRTQEKDRHEQRMRDARKAVQRAHDEASEQPAEAPSDFQSSAKRLINRTMTRKVAWRMRQGLPDTGKVDDNEESPSSHLNSLIAQSSVVEVNEDGIGTGKKSSLKVNVANRTPAPKRLPKTPNRLTRRHQVLDVLGRLAAMDDQERRGFFFPIKDIDLSLDEKYGLANKLREMCEAANFYLPPQSRKGPSFNYYAGLLCGQYYAFTPGQLQSKEITFGTACKSEIIQELLTVVDKPLGFTIMDSPPRRILYQMLYWLKPSSYLFAPEMRVMVELKGGNEGLWIPVSGSRSVRFNKTKIMANQQLLAHEPESAHRNRALRKLKRKYAEALNCIELIARNSRRLALIYIDCPSLGITLAPEVVNALQALTLFK